MRERQAEAQRREEQAECKKTREAVVVPDLVSFYDGLVLSTPPDGLANPVMSRTPVAKESVLS